MTHREILEKLKSAIYTVQEYSGEEFVSISDDCCPLDDLPGFDSYRAIEVTVELSGLLGSEKVGENNLFVSRDGQHPLKVNEVVDEICKLMS